MVYDYCGHCIILFYFESFAFCHLVIYLNIAVNSKIPREQKWFCYIVSVFVADQQWADVWTNGKEQSLWSTFCCSMDLRRIFRVSETVAWIIYVTILASFKKKIIQKAPLEWSVSTHFVTDCSFLKHFFWSSYKLPPSWALLKPLTKLYKSRAYKWSLRKPSRPYIIVKVASNQVQFLLPPLLLGLVLGILPAYSVAINNVF